jgi:hypothetical protein
MNVFPILAAFGLKGPAWIVIAAAFAFWVWMLVDCANHENEGSTKIAWLLIILLAGVVGAPLYFFVRKLPRNT